MSRASTSQPPHVMQIRVYAAPYAYTPNGEPLYIAYGGVHASMAAQAVLSLRQPASAHSSLSPLSQTASPHLPQSESLPLVRAPSNDTTVVPNNGQFSGDAQLQCRNASPQRKRLRADPMYLPRGGPQLPDVATDRSNLWTQQSNDSSAGHPASPDPAGQLSPAKSQKKARLVWTESLHASFVRAVEYLGVDIAVPKAIMQIMNVDSLTRENVASHLQKYRANLKKVKRDRAKSHLNTPLFVESNDQQSIAKPAGHLPSLQDVNNNPHSLRSPAWLDKAEAGLKLPPTMSRAIDQGNPPSGKAIVPSSFGISTENPEARPAVPVSGDIPRLPKLNWESGDPRRLPPLN